MVWYQQELQFYQCQHKIELLPFHATVSLSGRNQFGSRRERHQNVFPHASACTHHTDVSLAVGGRLLLTGAV